MKRKKREREDSEVLQFAASTPPPTHLPSDTVSLATQAAGMRWGGPRGQRAEAGRWGSREKSRGRRGQDDMQMGRKREESWKISPPIILLITSHCDELPQSTGSLIIPRVCPPLSPRRLISNYYLQLQARAAQPTRPSERGRRGGGGASVEGSGGGKKIILGGGTKTRRGSRVKEKPATFAVASRGPRGRTYFAQAQVFPSHATAKICRTKQKSG